MGSTIMSKIGKPGYLAAHARVSRTRGPASRFPCVTCGKPARDWSYNHGDDHELTDDRGRRYSLNTLCYEPRCRTCHIEFDRQHKRKLAEPFKAEVKNAVAQRDRARRHNDWNAEAYWDDELDRLATLLKAI